jgi:zinc protease
VEELRENESGVYGVGARGSMNKVPYGSYNFSISFPCGPENAEKLTESALRELNKMVTNGPEQKDLDKFKEASRLEFKESLKENRYWMAVLKRQYTDEVNPEEIFDFETKLNALTVKDLHEVAKKYLAKDKVIGILMPEE